MTTSGRSGWWKLGLGSVLAMGGMMAASGDYAFAQITPDATLGTETVVTPNVIIRDVPSDRIDGGATRGANLFHSFLEFNIGEGRGAYFTNPTGIENILSRVTGGNLSNILGKLGVLGNANLFLINPNGIIFGSNASLDIRGSFVGSTASSLNFADGTYFSATAPPPTPLLTVSVPLGLQYGGNAGSVQVQGSALQVDTGQTLALVGGNVSVNGGRLQAAGGRVELGGLAQAGWVGLNVDANPLSLSFPDGATAQTPAPRADVSLTNASEVRVAASGGGSIAINARNLEVLGESSLIAGVGEGLGSPGIEAGDISLSATEAIAIGQSSSIQNLVNQNAIGNSGDINITAGSVSLSDRARLNASTFGQGDAGRIFVQARDSVSLTNGFILSNVSQEAIGNVGSVQIEAGTVSLTNGAQLQANIVKGGQGNAAGIISVRGTDSVSFAGRGSSIYGDVESRAVGNSSDIQISARSVSLTNGVLLNASNAGHDGNAGRVSVQATDLVLLADSNIFSDVESGGMGNGGNINITAGSVSLTDGAQVATSIFGQGNAGSVFVQANDSVALTGSGTTIFSNVGSEAVGNVGSVWIEAGTVSLTNGAQLQAGIYSGGQGNNAGIVSVRGRGSVSFAGRGSVIFSDVELGAVGNSSDIQISAGSVSLTNGAQLQASNAGQGNAGNINITAGSLLLTDGAQVATSISGQGNAGSVFVQANDSVALTGTGTTIFSNVEFGGVGDGGAITINAGTLSLTDGAQLQTLVRGAQDGRLPGQGNAGSVFIQTDGSVSLSDGAGVSVDSQGQGNAGNLQLQAGSVTLEREAFLSATTASGEGGDITLRSQDLLLLRRNSQISTAARGTGNGGNIDIAAGFIVALPSEDSNIIADAIEGQGGNINITTQGIFGIQPSEQQTPQSDITASSELGIDGEVEITRPDVDPNQGLVTLPAELVDASGLIATGCSADGEPVASNEFIITGRGGLPPNPGDTLSGEAVLVNWATLDPEVENRSDAEETATNPTKEPAPTQIVEAQGWVFGSKGEVILTASAPTVTPHSAWLPTVDCSN